MDNANNNYARSKTEAASAAAAENAVFSRSCQGLSPEAVAPWLADLKRQIALRQAMP